MNDIKHDDYVLHTDQVFCYFKARGSSFLSFKKVYIKAVDGVSLAVPKGLIHGVVGESGCGKSTLANLLILMLRPTGGSVRYNGKDVSMLRGKAWRALRRDIQMIYQNPIGSLDPRLPIRDQIIEALTVHRIGAKKERAARAAELLSMVGIDKSMHHRIPGRLSGGQAQRVAIARALAVEPQVLVADEPVSALDVSVQAQILQLLDSLRERTGISIVLISHDLRVVCNMSDLVTIMYMGRVVETGPTQKVFQRPMNPYTKALIHAVPDIAMDSQRD